MGNLKATFKIVLLFLPLLVFQAHHCEAFDGSKVEGFAPSTSGTHIKQQGVGKKEEEGYGGKEGGPIIKGAMKENYSCYFSYGWYCCDRVPHICYYTKPYCWSCCDNPHQDIC